jgi:signal transduction histidine kinase
MFKLLRNLAPATGSEIHDKANRLTSNTVVLVALFSCLMAIADYSAGFKITAAINISLFPISLTSLYLMKKGSVLISKIVILVGTIIIITLLSPMFKQETIILAYYIPLILSIQVVLQGTERKYGRVLMLISITCLATLLFTNFKFPYAYILSENELKIQLAMNISGALFFCLMISDFIYKVNADITMQLHNQSKELLIKNGLLNATIETRDRLFSLISHDLRSPFQSIEASIELLGDPNISKEEQTAVLKSLDKKSENTIALLNNLLLWSQHQTDTIKFDPEPIYLDQLEESVLNIMVTLAEEKRLKTIVNFEPGVAVFADKNMLEAILRNLISNAIKFSTNGGEIELNAYFKNDYVVFSVIDIGIGLVQSDLKKLLSKQQHTSTGTNNEQGHGIGLLLVHEFIEQHGSELKIESELGKGSKFSFQIKAISG